MTTKDEVFISYSHKDAEWLKRLRVHLAPLMREGTISLWDDSRIQEGSIWREEIEQALARARVAVLLVSADFLASEFIATNELPQLLTAAKQNGTVILPVIVRPCRFEHATSLSRFQAVNSPAEPLVGMRRVRWEAVFVKLSDAIVHSLSSASSQPTVAAQPDRSSDQPAVVKEADSHNFSGPEWFWIVCLWLSVAMPFSPLWC